MPLLRNFARVLAVGVTICLSLVEARAQETSAKKAQAEAILKQGGRITIRLPDDSTKTLQKKRDVPEGPFVIERADFGGQSQLSDEIFPLIQPLKDLEELNLSYTRISDKGLSSLTVPKLSRLYLSETIITDESLPWLAKQTELTSLDLSGTQVTDKQFGKLATLEKLSHLYVSRLPLTGDFMKPLENLSQLRVFYATGAKLSAEGVETLQKFENLEEVSLTAEDAALEKLTGLKKLKRLMLTGNTITDEGLAYVGSLNQLEQLRLSQTRVTVQGVSRVRSTLKTCRIMAQQVSRQSAFLRSSKTDLSPVIRWTLGSPKNQWMGLVSQPADLPGIARWQIETRAPRSEITSVDYSPNGAFIAIGTVAGHLRIYNTSDLQLEKLVPAHPGGVSTVQWSPDGLQLATGGADGRIRIWNHQGEFAQELKGHTGNVLSVRWSKDGFAIASGSTDKTVRIWNLRSKINVTMEGHSGTVSCVSWSPDQKFVASGSLDKTIYVWTREGESVQHLKGHTDRITSLAWSPRSTLLASGSWDKTVRFWNPRTGRGGPVLEHGYRLTDLEWHPQGSTLASSGSRFIKLWTLDGTPVRQVKSLNATVTGISWKHDGNEIAYVTKESSLLGITAVDGQSGRTVGQTISGGVLDLAWHPSGDRIAIGHWDHSLRMVTSDGQHIATGTGTKNAVKTVGWKPDGTELISGGDGELRFWNRQGTFLRSLKAHDKAIHSADWHPSQDMIATTSEDKTVRIWSTDGKALGQFSIDARGRCVRWSPDGKRLAILVNSSPFLVDPSGRNKTPLSDPPAGINALTWDASRNHLSAGGWNRTLQTWDQDGKTVGQSKQPEGILDLALHPDGSKMLVGMSNSRVSVADPDGTNGNVWKGHSGRVLAVAWHPDGAQLATGGEDNTLKFWKPNGEPLRSVLFFENGQQAVFTAAGQLESGELSDLDNDLVYLVETESGERLTLSPSEFEKRLTTQELTTAAR